MFYRTTNLKTVWGREVGCLMDEGEWLIVLSNNGKYIREAKGKPTYKITHMYYWTPQRLNRAGLLNNNLS